MRRGCVSLGEIRCDSCKKVIPTAVRYIVTDEETDETGKKKMVRYCINCCLQKGFAGYRKEKDEKILTFFPADEAEEPPQPRKPEAVKTESTKTENRLDEDIDNLEAVEDEEVKGDEDEAEEDE